MGIYSDGTFEDLTKLAQWVSSNTAVATMSAVAGFEGVAVASPYTVGTATVMAGYSGITSNAAMLEVRYY
jgi:hypothetical protein